VDLPTLLLPHLGDNPNAAAAVFGAIRNYTYASPAKVLPDDVVLASLRQPVAQAELAAAAAGSAKVLDRMARDKRRRVRRKVAAHPMTSASTLAFLWEKSYAEDNDTIGILCDHPRLPIESLVGTWDIALRGFQHYARARAINAVAANLTRRATADNVAAVVAAAPDGLAAVMLAALHAGEVGVLPFADAVALLPSADRPRVLAETMLVATTTDVELAEAFLRDSSWEHLVDVLRDSPLAYSRRSSTTEWTPPAAARLLAGPVPATAVSWLGDRRLPVEARYLACERAFDALQGHATTMPGTYVDGLDGLGSLLVEAKELVDARLFQRMLDLSAQLRTSYQRHSLQSTLVEVLPADMDTETVYVALDQFPHELLVGFLSGACPRKPRPGEIAGWVGRDGCEQARERLASALLDSTPVFDAALASPWGQEAVDACGPELALRLYRTSASHVAAFIAARAAERLGDDPDAWRTFLSLSGDLGSEPLDELLDAVCALMGRP
jgi:hypothetical protein